MMRLFKEAQKKMRPKGLKQVSSTGSFALWKKKIFKSIMLELEVTVRINSTNQELYS